jgi:hypothetical protein
MSDEVTLESLQADVSRLRQELVDARVERAAKHLEWMRTWMSVYTPTVTLVFIIFTVLGYRGLSDIETNRKKVEGIAGQVEIDAAKAETVVKDVSDTIHSSQQAVGQFKQQVQENQDLLTGLQSSQAALRSDYEGLRATSSQIEAKQRELFKNQELTSSSLSSSISFTSGLGNIVSQELNVPLIRSVTFSTQTMTIEGFGFGSSGRIFVSDQDSGPLFGDLSAESGAVEIPSGSVSSWNTNQVVCSSSGIKIPQGVLSSLRVQLITQSGEKTNVYTFFPPLLPPTISGVVSQ